MSYHRVYSSDINPPPYWNDKWPSAPWTRNFPLGALGPADLSTNQAGSCSGLAAGALCMMWSGSRPSAGDGRWVPGHCPNVPGKHTECWVPPGAQVAPPSSSSSGGGSGGGTAPVPDTAPLTSEDTGGTSSTGTVVLVGGIVALALALGFVGYKKLAAKRESRDVRALAAATPHRAVRRSNRRRARRHRAR